MAKKRAELKLGSVCNNNCKSCIYFGKKNPEHRPPDSITKYLGNLGDNCKEVLLTGGEPTLRKDLIEIIRFVKERGLLVSLETNGRAFFYLSLVKEFVSLGLRSFIVKVYSHDSQLHDSLTRTPGSFNQMLDGIRNLLDCNQNVQIKVLCVKQNYKEIVSTVNFFRETGVKDFVIALPGNLQVPQNRSITLDITPYIYKLKNNFSDLNFDFVNFDDSLLDLCVSRFPRTFYIDVTNKCNFNCAVCTLTLHNGREKRDLSFSEFKKIIRGVGEDIERLIIPAVGEPTLNKDIYSMIKYAKDNGVREINLLTNGSNMNEKAIKDLLASNLDNVYIALDGACQETYEKFRIGGNFKEVKNNIKNLVLAKKHSRKTKPNVFITFLVHKHNEFEIPKIKIISNELGVDGLHLKFIDFGGKFKYKSNDFLPEDFDLSIYRNKDLEKKPYNSYSFCDAPWNECVISSNGDVYFCCKYGINFQNSPGNIFEERFKDIWNNTPYRLFRKGFLEKNPRTGLCKYCIGRINRSKLITLK